MKKLALILTFAFAASGCVSGTALDAGFTAPLDSAEFAAACEARKDLANTYERTDAQLQAVKGIALGVAALGLMPIDALGAVVGTESVAKGIVREDINHACNSIGEKQ
ncbi:MAG: hypothetical protein ACR2PR_09270 [Pseudohongiellaceae bacterium]